MTLRQRGHLSDVDLWVHMRDQAIGGLGSTIVLDCLDLQRIGYIEKPANDPHLWQLSNKGLEYLAAQGQQEVQLGTN